MALSTTDKALIEAKAYTYSHNYAYYSLILGEPFIRDNFLFFFDGKMLSINTYFLEPGPALNLAKLKNTIREIAEAFKPEGICIWGPRRDEDLISPPNGWTRFCLADPHEFNRDLALILPTFRPHTVPHLEQALHSARRNGISIVNRAAGPFSVGHISLLEEAVARNNPDLFTRVFYSILPTWLITSESGLVFEAWQGSQLLGYVILDLVLPNLPIYLAGFSSTSSIMDVLFNAMIGYCTENGHEKLVLGHSHQGETYRYKMKWGQYITQDAFWRFAFFCPRASISSKNYTWDSRVLL